MHRLSLQPPKDECESPKASTERSDSPSEKMTAICPGRKTRMVLDIVCFILCLLVVIIQLGVLDLYYIHYLKELYWYSWIAGDVLVIVTFIALLVIAIRYNQRCMEEVCTSDANIKYAFLAWFVYSLVLAGKVAVCFQLFYNEIKTTAEIRGSTTAAPPLEDVTVESNQLSDQINDIISKYFGQHTFKLTLSLSAVIFLLLVEAHHYTHVNSPRQLYLTYLSTAVSFDILDSVIFLQLLWVKEIDEYKDFPLGEPLKIAILVLACFNFFLPTFALLKLRFRKMPRFIPLPYEKFYALIYVLTVNIPYLAIRALLWWYIPSNDVSVFAVKNAIMVYLAFRELWTRFQYYRQKKAGNCGELTGVGAVDDDARLKSGQPI